jgi:hypothetical protein
MAGLLDFFDPSAYGSPAPSGILPPWLSQTIAGLQNGPSMLQSFPPARLPMAPGTYPTGSPVAGSPLMQPGQQPVAQGDTPAPLTLPAQPPIGQGGNPAPIQMPMPASMPPPGRGVLPPAAADASASPGPGSVSGAGIGDRLGAGLLGFAHSGGAIPALANLISGLATGQRSDPQGMMLAQQAATVRALRSAGLSNPEAIAAMHPALARVLLAHAYRRSPSP